LPLIEKPEQQRSTNWSSV